MRKPYNIIFLFSQFLIFLQSCAQQPLRQALIVAEYRVDSPKIGNFTYLTAYHFSDGAFVSKDTLVGYPTSRKGYLGSYVRFDLGSNFIHQNRYVISGVGNVIDMKERRLLLGETDQFIEAYGDTILFHRDNIFTGTGFMVLNLKTGKYGFINHKERERDNRYSPDKKQFLEVDQSAIPYKIKLTQTATKKSQVVVADAGSGPNLFTDSQFPTIFTYWLNDTEFLYSVHRIKYPITGEIKSDVELRVYNTLTGVNSFFDKLDSLEKLWSNDRILKDGIGQLIYRSSSMEKFLLDTAARKLRPYTAWQYGHDFSADNSAHDFGELLLYQEKEIGRLWCTDITITNKAIAVSYGEQDSNLGYPAGIKVWTPQSGKWITVDLPWFCTIIGWRDE